MYRTWVLAGIVVCAAAGIIGSLILPSAGAQLPAAAVPDDCACSKGVYLSAGKEHGLHMWNCMCGAMQCVVATHGDRREIPAVVSCR